MGHPDVNQRTIRPRAPRGNQRRPMSASPAGRVCGCASGSVKFPAYCRRVRFRVGWCRTTAVGPCTGQWVNSAEKGEIVDSGRRGHRQNWNGSESDGTRRMATRPRRRRDADDVPRYRRCPHTPLDSISAFCLTRPGLKAFASSRVYYTHGSYDVCSWQWCEFSISLFCISSLQNFHFLREGASKWERAFYRLRFYR